MMEVKVIMTIRTEDYGGKEFFEEVKKLMADIDPESELVFFDMFDSTKGRDNRSYLWSADDEFAAEKEQRGLGRLR